MSTGRDWMARLRAIPNGGRVFPEAPCARCQQPTTRHLLTSVVPVETGDPGEASAVTGRVPWCDACEPWRVEQLAKQRPTTPEAEAALRAKIAAENAAWTREPMSMGAA